MEFLKDENIGKNANLAESIARLNEYDLILFLKPDVLWIQDGDRSEKIAADREKFSERMKALYEKFGFNCVEISRNYVERYEKSI